MTLPRMLRWGLLATFVLAGVLLAGRAWIGPYTWVNSPMNAEAICALAAMFLWTLPAPPAPGNVAATQPRGSNAAILAALAAVVILNFWSSLSFPLIFDDYVHVAAVLRAGPGFWLDQFTVPAVDHFFRPLGMYDYRLDAILAGPIAFLWRCGNLFWHTANAILLFFLARRLGLNVIAAIFAALLFSVHGSRPESAAWVAGRFDLLATFFLLTSLLLFYRAAAGKSERPLPTEAPQPKSTIRYAAMLAAILAGLAALLSKESSYVWPLLVTLLFWRKLSAKVLLIPYVLTGIVFLYRWRLLSGIGGYQTGEQPDIFVFSAVRTAKALFTRLWATLWFPINWSLPLGTAVAATLIAMLIAVAWLCSNRPRMHWTALAFVFISALPVQHLLLIGQDMEKSRVLYLPSVGFAILLGHALQTIVNRKGATTAGIAILLFQSAALQHNLAIWGQVATLGRTACEEAGVAAQLEPTGSISVMNLPKLRHGVYFLGNGFPQCVEWHTTDSKGRSVRSESVRVLGNLTQAVSGTVYFFDESDDHFVRVR